MVPSSVAPGQRCAADYAHASEYRACHEFSKMTSGILKRRLMEVAAGYAEHVDVQVGRIADELDRLGYGENTLFFYIWGDNGSSGEGQNGTIAELLAQNGIPTTVRQHIDVLDELGGLDVLGSRWWTTSITRRGHGRAARRTRA